MKRLIALTLAFVMLIGLFAACGDKKQPSNDNTGNPDNSQSGNNGNENQGNEAQGNDTPDGSTNTETKTATGILDATDGMTIAIENHGAAYADRIGIVA